jgi:antirestriction protein
MNEQERTPSATGERRSPPVDIRFGLRSQADPMRWPPEGSPSVDTRPAGLSAGGIALDSVGDAAIIDTEAQPRDGPRIYAASLSDYNNGILHGRWIEATDDAEAMGREIEVMLSESPTARLHGDVAEEWAIHDYEGFGELRIGEYQGLTQIARLARGIGEHGLAFAAWAAHVVGMECDEIVDQFDDRYQGEWDSLEAYAEMLLEELGADRIIDEAPEWLQPYISIDADGFSRDLEISGDIVTVERPDGGVWIFAGH